MLLTILGRATIIDAVIKKAYVIVVIIAVTAVVGVCAMIMVVICSCTIVVVIVIKISNWHHNHVIPFFFGFLLQHFNLMVISM